METWVRGRATKEAKATDLSVDYLISEILDGKLTKSQVLLTNEFYKVYALHKRKINDAFDTAGESKSYQTIADLDAGKFKKTVLFIQAESGVGKTVLAKVIIITSTKTPSEFFSIAKGNFHEDLGQFFRRIDLLINIEDDKFHLSKPEKAPPASTFFPYVMKPPSHYFRFYGTYYKNKALDKVTKVVIRNMQWNKKKPVTQPAKANMTDSFKK